MRLAENLRKAMFLYSKTGCVWDYVNPADIAYATVDTNRSPDEVENAKKVLALKVGEKIVFPSGAVWKRVR